MLLKQVNGLDTRASNMQQIKIIKHDHVREQDFKTDARLYFTKHKIKGKSIHLASLGPEASGEKAPNDLTPVHAYDNFH